ncbi:MAG: hypothetical protein ACLGIP_18925 [Alphaproteobacteria bacterium]
MSDTRIRSLEASNAILRRELQDAPSNASRAFWRGVVLGAVAVAAISFGVMQ